MAEAAGRRARQQLEGELSYKENHLLEDSAPNVVGGRSARFVNEGNGSALRSPTRPRPELKSPTAARATGVRLLAGRPLESGVSAISRNEKLCGFGHFHS